MDLLGADVMASGVPRVCTHSCVLEKMGSDGDSSKISCSWNIKKWQTIDKEENPYVFEIRVVASLATV